MTAAPPSRVVELRAELAATARLITLAGRARVSRQDVLDALLAETAALLGADGAAVVLREGGTFRLASGPELPAALLPINTGPPVTGNLGDRLVRERRAVQVGVDHGTVLGVPLLWAGELAGFVALRRPAGAPFTPHQIDAAVRLCDHAAPAVENARIEGQLRERGEAGDRTRNELDALREVTQVVSSSTDLDTVSATILRAAVRLAGGVGGAVRGSAADTLPMRAAQGVAGRGMRSVLEVPLRAGDQVLGVVSVWRPEPDGFTPDRVSMLGDFATQAALALRTAQLSREVEIRNPDAAAGARRRAQLFDLSASLQEPLSLSEGLGRVLDAAREVVEVDRASVWALTPDGSALRCLAAAGLGRAERRGFMGLLIPVGQGWGESLPLPGIYDEDHPVPAFLQTGTASRVIGRVRRLLVVPMIARGATVGVIVADNKPSQRPLRPETAELVAFFASHAAVAVQNARLFAEIGQRRAEVELASRHKSQFLATMSHELRTPLNAIIGYSEILAEEATDEGRDDLLPDLEKITGAGRHLLDLIDAVLDLGKIEAGRMELSADTVDIARLAADARAIIAPLAAANGNRWDVVCAPGIGSVRADRTKVRQALFNLISNACKFTDHGSVTLEVTRDGGRGPIRLAVTDTGIGLTPEQLGTLFREFTQAELSTSRRFGGTGLGLALSRRMCRLMGGDITVSSEAGVGSTFTISLPSADTAAPAPGAARQGAHPASGAVLVVDDDDATRDLLVRLLAREGRNAVGATGGLEGLRLARELHPAAVTLDIAMPDLDGWAVLAALKADPATATIPVIVTTVADERNLARARGAAAYLAKPVDRAALLAALAQHIVPSRLDGPDG